MAKKPNTAKPAAAQTAPAVDTATLSNIVAATVAGGFVYVAEAVAAPLVAAGYIETNAEMKDEAGNIAARSTDAGNALINSANTAPAAAQPGATTAEAPKSKPSFEIEDNVPLPTIKRGGIGGTTYPFDALNVGQSFHVAASEDKPNPAKSLASTVSSATARYAVEVKDANGNPVLGEDGKPQMQNTRVFSVRTVGKDDPKGPGARVWRTA